MHTRQLSYPELVDGQVARLKTRSLRAIEEETIAKRLAWCDLHLPARNTSTASTAPSPRAAFEALFFQYMGLDPKDIPVLHEDENEIAWSSLNPCPTLEACQQLGLDTRAVCPGAYEKSTQAFLSRIDSQLRFIRVYREIRPYSHYCLERIVRVPFEERMQLAIQEAKLSRQEGNKGYGAVAVLGERILAQAHDTAITDRDPSQHAEMRALRQAAQLLGNGNLSGVVLFSSCEPCPMCASMAVWSNISTIVYGASIALTAVRGKSRILVSAEQIIQNSPVRIELIPGVLQNECMARYE
jgi:tRNA(Arg) A34 adenosine deaminase TadA